MRIVALAGQVAARSPLAAHGVVAVERLHAQTGAEAHIVVPSYLSALCIVHADGCGARPHPRELVPAHCTATGKTLLAWRQRWRDSVLGHALERRTDRTVVDPAALATAADETRSRGYALEDGELEEGVRAVAAPVFVGGEAVAALGVSGRELDAEGLADRVVVLADELTAAMARNDG
jgi:DNA-binding IclR family transcriptional regulator